MMFGLFKKKVQEIGTIYNCIIQVGDGTRFDKCNNVGFEHCTFYSDTLTSDEIVKKVRGVIGACYCIFLGNDRTGTGLDVSMLSQESGAYKMDVLTGENWATDCQVGVK